MANITEVVVGATRKDLRVTVVDEFGNPVDITAGFVRLEATSEDLPTVEIDEAGTLYDPANGVAQWAEIGTFVTDADMGSKLEATYVCRVKYTDAAGKFDWGPKFSLTYVQAPLEV